MSVNLVPTRAMLERLLALGGLLIVLLELFVLDSSALHVIVIGVGTLMIYVGTWRLTGGFVSQRSNVVLRAEINRFLVLVRQLYGERSRGDSAGIHETKSKLRDSAERIISAAANYKDEI